MWWVTITFSPKVQMANECAVNHEFGKKKSVVSPSSAFLIAQQYELLYITEEKVAITT